ncbi:MAG: ABC transporter permease [Deinococcota bacterium]|nr:ABC transporter permease [Deinococcota bacterium]
MELESWLISATARSLAFATPLLFAALGEIIAERAGVVNLGVEGMMIVGALAGFVAAQASGNPLVGVFVAALAAGLAALLHAFLAVTVRADQYVSGLALTIFGLGLTGVLGRPWQGQPLTNPFRTVTVPLLADLPFVGPAFFQGQHLLTYLAILTALALWFLLFYSRLGISVRSVGESPAAADALGVDVYLIRYGCVVFGGMMAGVGGSYLSLAYRPSWSEGMTAGMGWIALAIAIFAAWNPLRALWGAFLFGACFHLAFRLQGVLPAEFLRLLPYVATIVTLTLASLTRSGRRQGAPEALGSPYLRGER